MFCDLQWVFRSFIAVMLVVSMGCSKEKSIDPPTKNTGGIDTTGIETGGTAQYSVGNCEDATLAGTYQAGKILGTDATISIKVNVIHTGNWSMSSGIVNGMVFAGAGVFTTPGIQTITLQGTGTPFAVGTNFISYKTGNKTCSIAITTSPNDDKGSRSDYSD